MGILFVLDNAYAECDIPVYLLDNALVICELHVLVLDKAYAEVLDIA